MELRAVSGEYWTPLPIVRRVVGWLRETRVRTVVDIGSGAGKFCVAGALLTRCHFIGLEQRASLVTSARGLAEIFDVGDRVTFVHGDVGAVATPVGDAYYLFNPFGDYFFNSTAFDEPDAAFGPDTYRAGVMAVSGLLSRAPLGTFVITLNGFGGNMPQGYEQVDIDRAFSGTLRLMRQASCPPCAPQLERGSDTSGDDRVAVKPDVAASAKLRRML
jgi:hypothetical protein